jgi:two-component system, LytTR family, response regulator
MKKIRILVADDEPLARRGVRQLLTHYEDMEVVGECRNGRETLQAIETLAPDLLFLDVQMPEMDGFEVIRIVGVHRMPMLVFVTAYDNFAVQAFEAHALDYLVKPLNVDRFESTMVRIRERLMQTQNADRAVQLESLLEAERTARQAQGIDRLVLTTDSESLVIAANEIDWIEAEDYYSCLHFGAKTYLIRESLTSLQSRLNPLDFFRIHRSVIVRLERIRSIKMEEGGCTIVLHDGQHLPVSRRNRAAVKRLLHRTSRIDSTL